MAKIDLKKIITLLMLLIIPAMMFGRDAREQKRIDYLFTSLVSLKGAVFIRNGSEYDANAARDHLKKKLDYAGERVKTAEQFIEYCASKSSMSHKSYQIRMSDGTVTDTASFFTAKLKEFDQKSR